MAGLVAHVRRPAREQGPEHAMVANGSAAQKLNPASGVPGDAAPRSRRAAARHLARAAPSHLIQTAAHASAMAWRGVAVKGGQQRRVLAAARGLICGQVFLNAAYPGGWGSERSSIKSHRNGLHNPVQANKKAPPGRG